MKETVKITDLTGNSWNYLSEWVNCVLVDQQILDVDLDLRCATMRVVVKRLTDNKLFKFQYEQGYEQPFYDDLDVAIEVSPVQKLLKIYE